jgi:hypothetical protein
LKFKVGDKIIFPEIKEPGNHTIWTIVKRHKSKYHPYKSMWKYWISSSFQKEPLPIYEGDIEMQLHEPSQFNDAMQDFLK